MKKLNLNSTTVLNKEFGIELSGYNANEVDEFLDKILEDYTSYEQLIRNYETTIDEKVKLINDKDEMIEKLRFEILNLKNQLEKTGKATNLGLQEKMDAVMREISDLKNKAK